MSGAVAKNGYRPIFRFDPTKRMSGRERIYRKSYPVELTAPGLKATLELPFREIPSGKEAIALLMTTQCDFRVIDGISEMLKLNVENIEPDVIVGLPTLGLPLAEHVARRLGHRSYVPLTNSVKFWQGEHFSVPVSSITSVGGKLLHLDPFLVPSIHGKRVLIQDDVVNTGESMAAALELMIRAGAADIYMSVVMTEGHAWEQTLDRAKFDWRTHLLSLGTIPMFTSHASGGWVPNPATI